MTIPSGHKLLARIRDSRFRRGIQAARNQAARRCESLYLVGGCVRDLLQGCALKDLDLVVEGDPGGLARDTARVLRGRAHGPTPFGTCRIEAPGGLRLDVAMARREEYAAPAALPRVSPAPIDEDLLRRDFTINSMAVGLTGPCEGRVLDPSGGERDLSSGRLRLHHGESLVDDPTRVFRAARYAARFSLLVAPGWRAAMTAATRRGAFRRLSPARIRRELQLVWQEIDPAAVLARGSRWGLLRRIDPGLRWSPEVKASIRNAASLTLPGEELRLRLMFALLLRAMAPAGRPRLCRRIDLGGMTGRRVLEAARAPEEAEALALAWRRSGRDPRKLAPLSRRDPLWQAAALAAGPPSTRSDLSEMTQRWMAARPRLNGKDVMDLGVPRGPAVGRVLRAIRLARAAGRIRTRGQEADLVRTLAPRGRKNP